MHCSHAYNVKYVSRVRQDAFYQRARTQCNTRLQPENMIPTATEGYLTRGTEGTEYSNGRLGLASTNHAAVATLMDHSK